MSRLPRPRASVGVAATVLMALGVPAAPASGQEAGITDRADRKALLEARVAELEPRWHALHARARVADSLRDAARPVVEGVPLDTLAYGPVRVVTPAAQRARTDALWSGVWATYGPLVPPGSALEGQVFGFQWSTKDGLGLAAGQRALRVGSRWLPERGARRAVERALGDLLARDLPSDLAAWSERAALAAPDYEEVYRRLAVSGLAVVERCFLGDMDACWTAVGAAPGRAGLVDALTPAEARALVGRRSTPPGLPWEACLEAGDDGACRRVLLEDASWLELLPAAPEVRASLLWTALEMGGAGAVERAGSPGEGTAGFEGSDGPPPGRDGAGPPAAGGETASFDVRARLAGIAAADGDGDEVMERWRERVLDARPDSHADVRGVRALTALWVLVFGFLATRSTRWRFG